MLYYRKTGHFSRSSNKTGEFHFAFVRLLLIGIGQGFLFQFQNRMYFLDHSKNTNSINMFLSLKVSPHKFIRAYHNKVKE